MKTPEDGAATQVLLAITPEEEIVNGGYYGDLKVENEAVSAKNEEDAKKLYDYCDEMTMEYQAVKD